MLKQVNILMQTLYSVSRTVTTHTKKRHDGSSSNHTFNSSCFTKKEIKDENTVDDNPIIDRESDED